MPVHLGDNVKNVVLVHHHALSSRLTRTRRAWFPVFPGVLFLVAHGGRAFKILVLDGAFLFGFDFLNLNLERLGLRWPRIVPMRAREPDSSITSIALSAKTGR